MKTLKSWTLTQKNESGVELLVDDRHTLLIRFLENTLVRVILLRNKTLRHDRTWSITPDQSEVPFEGRRRLDVNGFENPAVEVLEQDCQLTLTSQCLRVVVSTPLALRYETRLDDGSWTAFAADRSTGAYMLGTSDNRHAHFLFRHDQERIDGLGEKSGDLNRVGRRFEMRNLDAMGYDARTTDPLYKHIPFTITRTANAGAYGLFYDNMATCQFDLGNELDNYHKPYRAYRAEDGDLDFYLFWAPSVLDVVKRQVSLTGGTAFPPRWSLGYSGSTMAYTDAENAQEQLEGFVSLVTEHEIPCDSFQLSSGYTSIGPKRYVFNWNLDKIPSPETMVETFRHAGLNLIANIKPVLLQDHPRYAEAQQAGLFVEDTETGQPERSMFWDDEGSHLDFTNPRTVQWWQSNVKQALLERGISSTWNDNNEYEVWDSSARCHGFGQPVDIGLMRPVQPVLMTRASCEAQQAHQPDKRPYLISRSGSPGLQRYAQTWTGDNRTNWDSLRYNIRMGLGLSLSGFFNIGHDTGGFAGPKPEPELFVRWVQNGIFHPRFTIHSWNDDATVNEPWMYPDATHHVRNAIKLRYRLLPYLYTLLYQAAHENEPMLRPLFLDHEHDPRCFEETDDFMLGRDLLVATVVEPGATERAVYLPDNDGGWWDFHTGQWHAGKSTLKIPVTLGSIPLFVRAGAVLPLSQGVNRADPALDLKRHFAVFPKKKPDTTTSIFYEDDGESADFNLPEQHCLTRLTLNTTRDEINLSWTHDGSYRPVYATVTLTLPEDEKRSLCSQGANINSGETLPF